MRARMVVMHVSIHRKNSRSSFYLFTKINYIYNQHNSDGGDRDGEGGAGGRVGGGEGGRGGGGRFKSLPPKKE